MPDPTNPSDPFDIPTPAAPMSPFPAGAFPGAEVVKVPDVEAAEVAELRAQLAEAQAELAARPEQAPPAPAPQHTDPILAATAPGRQGSVPSAVEGEPDECPKCRAPRLEVDKTDVPDWCNRCGYRWPDRLPEAKV